MRFHLCAFLGLFTAAVATAEEPVRYNSDELVQMAVIGEIAPAVVRDSVYRVEADGTVRLHPSTGSITYNFRTGDSAINMAGNHVEPAVSIYNPGRDNSRTSPENLALNALSAIGNQATLVSGKAEGATGWVIGKHGGVEHLMVDFPAETFPQLTIGDRIQIRAIGAGMELENVDGVRVMNTSPQLIRALNDAGMRATDDGRLKIGVTHRIPAAIMGSGLGRDHVFTGDYDIQMFDKGIVEEYGLDSLRFGDIVAIMNADHAYGRIYYTGAISVGVVVHGRSESAGHGPGVTTLFTSREGRIELYDDADANLKSLLGID